MSTWYVDSVAGSNGNSGTSPAAPVATIACVLSLPVSSGDTIYLKCGGSWRETLTAPSGVAIAAYGTGTAPLLDCSDSILAASWSKTGGRTSVYESAGLPIGWLAGGTYDHANVWENGVQFARVATEALCDSTASSYYYADLSGTTFTLKIHTSDGTSPGSNGRTYEYSNRAFGASTTGFAVGTVSMTGIWTRRNLFTNGSLLPSGSTLNCKATDGGKHNTLVVPGSTHTGMTCTDGYFGAGGNLTLVVVNANVGAGKNTAFVNPVLTCTALNSVATGIYAHTNVSGTFGTLSLTGGTITSCAIGLDPGGHAAVSISGLASSLCTNCLHIAGVTSTITGCNLSSVSQTISVEGGSNISITNNILAVTAASGYAIVNPGTLTGTLTATGNTITISGSGQVGIGFGSSSANTFMRNAWTNGVAATVYSEIDPTKTTSNFNTFTEINASGSIAFISSTAYEIFGWRALSSQDLVSGQPLLNYALRQAGRNIIATNEYAGTYGTSQFFYLAGSNTLIKQVTAGVKTIISTIGGAIIPPGTYSIYTTAADDESAVLALGQAQTVSTRMDAAVRRQQEALILDVL